MLTYKALFAIWRLLRDAEDIVIQGTSEKISAATGEMYAGLQSPGRVNVNAVGAEGELSRLPGFAYATNAPKNAGADGIRGNFEKTVLNQAYFSPDNFQIVQNAIRFRVYKKTQKVIDPVSTDDLFMAMRAIFLQYGRNLPNNISGQIAELNERVVAWCLPNILAEVSFYDTYKKDISTMPVPLQHPQNLSHAGTKSLPLKPFM
jgi:hypothetical protein